MIFDITQYETFLYLFTRNHYSSEESSVCEIHFLYNRLSIYFMTVLGSANLLLHLVFVCFDYYKQYAPYWKFERYREVQNERKNYP